jgi:predicted nucleic acid-binding protein
MNKYVIDTSVAVKWFIVQPHYELAVDILYEFESAQCEIFVPSLIYVEFTNVIWKYSKFSNVENVDSLLSRFLSLDLKVKPTTYLLNEALNIAIQFQISVYDAVFIALAKELEIFFITADEKLVNAVSHELLFVKLLNKV